MRRRSFLVGTGVAVGGGLSALPEPARAEVRSDLEVQHLVSGWRREGEQIIPMPRAGTGLAAGCIDRAQFSCDALQALHLTARMRELSEAEQAAEPVQQELARRAPRVNRAIAQAGLLLEQISVEELAEISAWLRGHPERIEQVQEDLIQGAHEVGMPRHHLGLIQRTLKQSIFQLARQDPEALRARHVRRLDRLARRHGQDWRREARLRDSELDSWMPGPAIEVPVEGARERTPALRARRTRNAGYVLLGVGGAHVVTGAALLPWGGVPATAGAIALGIGVVLLIVGGILAGTGAVRLRRLRDGGDEEAGGYTRRPRR